MATMPEAVIAEAKSAIGTLVFSRRLITKRPALEASAGRNESAVSPTSKLRPRGTRSASMPIKCMDQMPVANERAAPADQAIRVPPWAALDRMVIASAVMQEAETAQTDRKTRPN